MKYYKAELYAMSHGIPYSDKRELALYGCQHWYLQYYRNEFFKQSRAYSIYELFYKKASLVVRRKPFHMLEDVETGAVFPEIKFRNGYSSRFFGQSIPDRCKLYHPNQRLYVRIESELDSEQIEQFFSSLTDEKKQYRKEEIERIIEIENQYWNPIPGKKYVKMIEQIRK